MVSAELSHNPYLLETKVLFNGHGPQVNSAIHKYSHEPLVDWADEVPYIYHNEMNGFEFDLYFSGTDADFACVQKAFTEAQVSEDSVRILRKGSLGGPLEKMNEVCALLDWLKENYNEYFSYDELTNNNPELLDTAFPLLIVHGEEDAISSASMSDEYIDEVSRLNDTDLTNTPIIVNVTPETQRQLSREIQYLLARKDVDAKQLFFIIHRRLKRGQIVRVLSDLGVKDPQVIHDADDQAIKEYVQAHLVSEYVRNAIRVFDVEVQRIDFELQKLNKRGKRSGAMLEGRISILDSEVARLQEVDDSLSQLASVESPREFAQARLAFRDALGVWRSRKRKIEGVPEAQRAASDFCRTIQQRMEEYSVALASAADEVRRHTDEDLASIYGGAGVDREFHPKEVPLAFPPSPVIIGFEEEFLTLKETAFVEPRRDFLGLFGSASNAEGEKVEVTYYYLDSWREKAVDLANPTLALLSESYTGVLRRYQREAIKAYRDHVAELMNERTEKKQQMVASLSDDDKVMRENGDWLSSFKSKLQTIKRG